MRYLPQTDDDRRQMLDAKGVSSIDDLFVDVPESARLKAPLDLSDHRGELEVERAMAALAANLSEVPEGAAWIYKIKLSEAGEPQDLMDVEAYRALID